MKRLSLPNYISRSGASFEVPKTFLNASRVVDTNTDTLNEVGIPIAQIDRDTYATTKEELHCFVIGESGCGKTRRVIMPSIRLMAKTGESMVISDPKGELYKYTGDSLKKRGYDVKVLNFRNPRNGDRWNPLHLIESLYRFGTPEEKDKAIMMSDDLVSIISTSVEDKEDQFWKISASNFFRGVAQIILEYGKNGDLTFENIALVAKSIYKAYTTRGITKNESLAVKKFIDSLPKNSPIVQNLSCITNNAEDTRNGINSVFEGMISMYCNQELLLDLFSKSEIDIASIGKKPTALFFILPDDSDAMYPVATYFVKQVYSSLVSLADEQSDGKLPNRVTFLLDEFANFAKLPTMHAMLTAARSRNIRFVLVCQSMDQLSQKYGNDGMEILLSNCRVWLYMSCRNLPFLRRLVDLAGQYISPYTGERFPLISVDMLQHFRMGQVLVFNDRCRPLIGYLDDYDKYDFGVEGKGDMSDLPETHSIITRQLFSWADAERTLERKNSHKEVPVSASCSTPGGGFGEIKISDELRSSIIQKPDVDKVSEDEKETSEQDEAYEEAKLYISIVEDKPDQVGFKNNLAYIIRHNKLNISNFKTNIDLHIPALLEQGCRENEPFSLMNMALYYIEQGKYDSAVELLSKIPTSGYIKLLNFWYNVLLKEENHIEGAFVSYICYVNNAFKNLPNTGSTNRQIWLDRCFQNTQYKAFLTNLTVVMWINGLIGRNFSDDSDK